MYWTVQISEWDGQLGGGGPREASYKAKKWPLYTSTTATSVRPPIVLRVGVALSLSSSAWNALYQRQSDSD